MTIDLAPAPDSTRSLSLSRRLASYGRTVHIGDHGRVVEFRKSDIPGSSGDWDLRHQPTDRAWFAILRFAPAGYVHSFTVVDRIEAARMVADGTHPYQDRLFWVSR